MSLETALAINMLALALLYDNRLFTATPVTDAIQENYRQGFLLITDNTGISDKAFGQAHSMTAGSRRGETELNCQKQDTVVHLWRAESSCG